MTIEQNKAFIRDFIAAQNGANWETELSRFIDPGEFSGYKSDHILFLKAFPDFHSEIETIVGEGDVLGVLVKASGTHMAEYPVADLKGIPPTGKHLEWRESYFIHFKDGKVAQWDFMVDNYNRLKQLGVME